MFLDSLIAAAFLGAIRRKPGKIRQVVALTDARSIFIIEKASASAGRIGRMVGTIFAEERG